MTATLRHRRHILGYAVRHQRRRPTRAEWRFIILGRWPWF